MIATDFKNILYILKDNSDFIQIITIITFITAQYFLALLSTRDGIERRHENLDINLYERITLYSNEMDIMNGTEYHKGNVQ